MKKKWLLVPTVVAVAAVLALAIAAGTALAQGDSQSTTSPWSTFTAKVAKILNLDEATVQKAMDQASKEIEDEALKARLDYQVQQGLITQEQADKYYQWYQSRPEGLQGGGFMGRGFGKGGFGRGGMPCGPGWYAPKSSTSGPTTGTSW